MKKKINKNAVKTNSRVEPLAEFNLKNITLFQKMKTYFKIRLVSKIYLQSANF